MSRMKKEMGVSGVECFSIADLKQAKSSAQTIFISLLEAEEEFLASMSAEDMESFQSILDTAGEIIWLTGANMLADPNPNLTLASGMARSLMMEQPSLKFTVIDVGSPHRLESNAAIICNIIAGELMLNDDKGDKEFILSQNGLLYVSRFGPDFKINSLFRRRTNGQIQMQVPSIDYAHPMRLSIGTPGVLDTLHFQELSSPPTDPPKGYIDVAVKAVSLNAKDIYAISGRVDTHGGTLALEFTGIVTATGSGVTDFKKGDRVLVSAPNHFSTVERVPAWSAHKLLPTEEFIVMATLPTAYGTALYALREKANLRAGESVLIHSGAGAFGIAAIILAQRTGAIVFTTVGSQSKREFLADELGVNPNHIFSSHDPSFATQLKQATGNKGVDVVINSLVGDLMHASWDCVARFGRFIEVGRKELLDAGQLDMSVFCRNVTFAAFDFSELCGSDNRHRQQEHIK